MRLYRNSYQRLHRVLVAAARAVIMVTSIARKTMIKMPEKIQLVISDAIQTTSIQLVYRAHHSIHQCHDDEILEKNATQIVRLAMVQLPQEEASLQQIKTDKMNIAMQKLLPTQLIVMAIVIIVAAMM